ncbi:MAG: hypothetical protein HN559_17555 [Gemmatimonadetes bacterium]|jgi:hypothetical protein|nr:hypothetical protein [Gemmatimonadota bacterium]MBT5592070.1 hypothetical protein [Gemmatimonadota bacterium]MBT5964652.1 hypothetical protein [Gemmatimonadota bacterium]MBT6628365.1 hypothetical protein [Gemmatimonadota bacterium]MBT7454383.1 hypothetical protein [Gemmatimonadota bacterium]
MFISDDYSAVVMNYTDPYYDISYAHSRPVKYITPVTSMLEDQLQDPGFEAASLLFEDRLRQHGNRVQLLNTQLAERDQIGQEHIDEINKAAMKCSGYLESLNDRQFPFAEPAVESKRQMLARMLLELEGQKRQEVSKCWADKAKLQTETLEATVDYEGSVRKHRQLTTW